ncbi:MAG TPA: alkaline phosphatase family protein [Vicinamibacterales bacterium]|nr:alkaline phosphatase family protein [Vicinamibacterales bacterium]
MRYLRMLSNSVVAAGLGSTYILALFIQLNPSLPVNAPGFIALIATVGLFYIVNLTVAFYLLLVLRQLLARDLFSPAWLSVDVLSWLGALASGAAAVLMWENLGTFGLVVDPSTSAALQGSSVVLALCSLSCVTLAIARRRNPEARTMFGLALVTVVAGSVVVPQALRGVHIPLVLEARALDAQLDLASTDRAARVSLVAIDGGSLDFITGATAEGRLPNFGKILDAGAVRHLATLRPTSAEAVWAAVATGKLPQKNGVRSAALYRLSRGQGAIELLPEFCLARGLVRLGLLLEESQTSAAFRARPLWSILGTHSLSAGIVGWPLTQPAPVVRGYVVSDVYHRMAAAPTAVDEPSAIYPPELQGIATAAMERVEAEGPMVVAEGPPVVAASLGGLQSWQETPALVDRIYDRIAQSIASARRVQVTLMRYRSLEPIGHYFLRYAMPSAFGDARGEVSGEDLRQLAGVLERHYALIDEALGRQMTALGPDDLLLVVSGYGMEPMSVVKRLIERVAGDPLLNGTHDDAPDGFLMAYGGAVARGRQQARASVVDVVPTILYFLGLPVGRDMDGFARTDLFQSSFTDERPIAFIPTYDR